MTVSPAWVVLVAIFVLGEWAKQIRSNRKNQQAVIDLIKLWICDALMVFIYPAFFYIFTTLSVVGQRIFALLLPVIKLLLRNLFARVTVDLSDATPEFVVFHAEVFNSLFMSYCMQTSPSVWTTLQITFADALLTIISLRDIENARRGLRNLELRIDRKNGWGSFHSSVRTGKYLNHTTLDRASKLLQLDENNESTRVSSVADLLRIASYREVVPKKEQSSRTLTILEKTVVIPNKVRPTGGSVHPDGNHELARNGSSQASITLRYTCKVRRLLYMAEFLILLNYVEVFIPMVFCEYLFYYH
ncbi:hypothetical protein P3T76_014145 [Phytophthora citrophthora]|uniref:Uncharacterized protein n=1 Tax=Phytophthora citrophthora TaxID=4793 RepID=A0AAD9LCN7_9STRA|nr:hypothetical protein P3T76_014145 [Phytophthora citrophthora]